jgi:hypothetical protein
VRALGLIFLSITPDLSPGLLKFIGIIRGHPPCNLAIPLLGRETAQLSIRARVSSKETHFRIAPGSSFLEKLKSFIPKATSHTISAIEN